MKKDFTSLNKEYLELHNFKRGLTHPQIIKQRKNATRFMNFCSYREKRKKELKELVSCNYTQNTRFYLLTYAVPCFDESKLLEDFKRFRRSVKELSMSGYVLVIEKHDSGAIHSHVLFFDVPYLEKDFLESKWSHGFVKIKFVYSIGVADYVSKYISKAPIGNRLFYQSTNLFKSMTHRKAHDLFGDIVFLKKDSKNACNIL